MFCFSSQILKLLMFLNNFVTFHDFEPVELENQYPNYLSCRVLHNLQPSLLRGE